MPPDVAAEVRNIITIASDAHPIGQREQARLWLTQQASASLTSHLEDACMRYLKSFMKDSFTDFLHIFRSKVEWFDCINHLEDQKLREYAITASRTAFKKDRPMSTVELWNMIEQKERNYTKPNQHFAPPPLANIAMFSASEKDTLLHELLASGEFGDFGDNIDVNAMRAKASGKKGGGRGGGKSGGGGGGGSPPGGGGRGSGGGGGGGQQQPRNGQPGQPAQGQGGQGGGGTSQRRSAYDATKWCTFCNRAGHDLQQCRSKFQVDPSGRQVVNPQQLPPGPSHMAPVTTHSQQPPSALPPIGRPATSIGQPPAQAAVSSLRAAPISDGAAASAERLGLSQVWSQPLWQAGIDR